MKVWKLILVFSILLILPITIVQAQFTSDESSPGSDIGGLDCSTCHSDIYESWGESSHAHGLTCEQCHLNEEDDLALSGHSHQGGAQECMDCHTTGYDEEDDTYLENDIHCTACHNPFPENHPVEPAPIDRSEDLCGECHIQARFEWQTSSHGKAGVACVTCHNQHSTSLKQEDISHQCATCHGDRVDGFSHSEHGEHGLSCADCHLAYLDGPVREGNAKRDHSFRVEISVCNACHSYSLHSSIATSTPQTEIDLGTEGEVDSMASNVTTSVSEDPGHVSHLALAGVFSLIGLSVGIIGFPIAKNLINKKNDKAR